MTNLLKYLPPFLLLFLPLPLGGCPSVGGSDESIEPGYRCSEGLTQLSDLLTVEFLWDGGDEYQDEQLMSGCGYDLIAYCTPADIGVSIEVDPEEGVWPKGDVSVQVTYVPQLDATLPALCTVEYDADDGMGGGIGGRSDFYVQMVSGD